MYASDDNGCSLLASNGNASRKAGAARVSGWQRRCLLWPHHDGGRTNQPTFIEEESGREGTGKRNQPAVSVRAIKGESRYSAGEAGERRERQEKRQRPYFPNADGRGRSVGASSTSGTVRVRECYL